MDNAIHISRKLQQIRDLVAEIESLMENSKAKQGRSPFYGVDSVVISKSYSLPRAGTRWITCSDICSEVGIDPTRSNCSKTGHYLSSIGTQYRRSNGKNLWHMPELTDEF